MSQDVVAPGRRAPHARALTIAVVLVATLAGPWAAAPAAGSPPPSAPVPLTEGMPAAAQEVGASERRAGRSGLRVVLGAVHRPTGMGMPTSSDPRRHLQAATVRVDVHPHGPLTRYYSSATVRLASAPGAAQSSITVGLGRAEGASCVIDESTVTGTLTSPSATDYTLFGDAGPVDVAASERPYDCAAVATAPPGSADHFDLVAGRLVAATLAPRVGVGPLRLLDRPQSRLRLVPGVRTDVAVTVHNTGPALARRVVLRTRGERLRASNAVLRDLAPGESRTVAIRLRLRGLRATRLRVAAAGSGVRAVRRWRVAPARPPAPARSGRYRSRDGDVRFAVRGNRIVGWRGRARASCARAAGSGIHRFPRVAVPANGIVQAHHRGARGVSYLRLRIVGGRVTRGGFVNEATNGCVDRLSFTARRTPGG